jgi:hypothetical protein
MKSKDQAEQKHQSNVREAAVLNLPLCSLCGVWRGDPCRTNRGRSTKPHAARLRQKSLE